MKRIVLLTAAVLTSMVGMAQLSAPDASPGHGYPVDDTVDVDLDVVLSWDPSLGGSVKKYHCQIDTNSDFSTPVNLNCVGTSAPTSELLFGKKYYWRARAEDFSGGFSPYSDTLKFTTFKDSYVLGEPFNPTGVGSLKFLSVTFGWTAVSGIGTYELQVSDDSLFSTAIVKNVAHPTNSVVVSDLKFNTKYFYRLRGSHSKDVSNWSAVKSMRTIATINQVFPTAGAANITVNFDFGCSNTTGVVEYQFELDTAAAFDTSSFFYQHGSIYTKDFNPSDPNFTFTAKKMKYGAVYGWRVRGLNSSSISAWSGVRYFNTVDKPTLDKPDDNETDVSENADFTWKHIIGTENYTLQIDISDSFPNPQEYSVKADTVTTSTVTREVVFHDFTHTYFWRVRASHSKSTSDWSDVRSFFVRPTGIEETTANRDIVIAPNPADDQVTITLKGYKASLNNLEMYDVLGNRYDRIAQLNWNGEGKAVMDISDLNAGLYFIIVKTDDQSQTRKLIVR